MPATADPDGHYCEALIRGIAELMLDPHRYFEQRLLGELATTTDREALRRQLLGWATEEALLTPTQRESLAAGLAAAGLPSPALALRDWPLARLLLPGVAGPADRDALSEAIQAELLGPADQAVVRRILAAAQD